MIVDKELQEALEKCFKQYQSKTSYVIGINLGIVMKKIFGIKNPFLDVEKFIGIVQFYINKILWKK